MAALSFPVGILLATVILCLSQQTLTLEGAKAEESLRPQATQGRATQQHVDGLRPIKKDYGLRTQPLSDSKRANGVPVESTSRRSTVRRIKVGSRVPVTTTPNPSNDDTGDGMLMADAGGKSSGAEDGGNEEKKTLAQQVAEGKYGLIQELLPNTVERPGVISYASNPEVPKDTADNLGGLGQEDIWLAEDHVLVLAGGSFRDKGGGLEPPWPPIDNYVAPRRQVKIPENPRIPPPFPVQLREGEPPRFIGDNVPPFGDNIDYPDFQNQGNYPTGPPQQGPGTSNGSYPTEVPQRPATGVEPGGPYPQTPLRPQAPGEGSPLPPAHYLPYAPPPFPPQNENFTPPLRPPFPFPPTGNLTEPFDEDDPSFYYPPPYDFYYPNDNTTEIPPGPLVPGIVLPPPPDFFAPLNETTRKEKRPPTTKEPATTKKIQGVDYKTRGNTRQRYRPTIPPKTKAPTIPTPGPSYLPVTTTTTETPTIIPKRVRPIHVKQRPAQRQKVLVQEHPNLVTTPPIEVIPATVTPLPFTSEGPEQYIGGKNIDLSNIHHVREKYPARNENEPLYYYNGPGVSQIVVTSTPRPIFVEEIYNSPKGGVTSPPPKSPKKQIIYIFTSPDQQDVVANQVSSTELPVSLKDHSKHEYTPEAPSIQTDGLGYKSELPTPPRLENFHNIGSKGQFYDFLPSPIDPGSSRGFRFPDEAPKPAVTPRPTNYLGDLNSEIQNLRQFAFENGAYNSKPAVYYSATAENTDRFNRTREEVNQAFRGQIYVPQVNNFQYRPSAYSSQAHPYQSNSNQGNEEVTIVTPKPVSTYAKTGRQRIPPSGGNGGVSIITVKPSVLYSGPVSAQGHQNHQVENLDLRGNGFKPSTYFLTSGVQGNKQNPSVSIVTPSPQIYNSDSLNEPNYEENPQEDERIRILQSARYSVRPLTASQNPSSYFSSDGSQVLIGENGGHQNNRFPQIYYSSSTQSPPETQNGIRYIYHDQPAGGFISSTPAPFYDSTPRAPKYISITPEDAKIVPDSRKKIPRPQYEEYFEANRSPPLSQAGQISGYDQVVPDGLYIQSTTPPTLQTSSRPRFNSQQKFAPYVHRVQTLQNIASSQPQQPVYITPVQHNNNNHQLYVHNTPAPPIQQSQYDVTSPKPSIEDAIYGQTTPAPVQYHYPINQQQNIAVTTPSPNFASIFNLPSTTYSPLPSYLTTKDVSLFDDATKNYFTIFGQKIGNQERESGQGQRYSPTTPLPPLAKGYDDSGRGPLVVTTSRPIEEERTVVSLVDDIRVNYRDPLPPINPNSEFISPVKNQPQPQRPSPSPAPTLQNSVRGGGALVSYQLPGVDGQGVGGGSRYYFLTPHSVQSVPQQRPFQQDSRLYNQWQRPIYNNYWRGRRSS